MREFIEIDVWKHPVFLLYYTHRRNNTSTRIISFSFHLTTCLLIKIEASDFDYTVLRPAWLTDNDEIDYEITEKGEAFKGTEVSRKSVASLVVKLVESPDFQVRGNLGVNKPNTDGDKPTFYWVYKEDNRRIAEFPKGGIGYSR